MKTERNNGATILSGRLNTNGIRCVVQSFIGSETCEVLVKCPGLGPSLMTLGGVGVKNGNPMLSVDCKMKGRFVSDKVSPYTAVFGDIEEVVVVTDDGKEFDLDTATFQDLSKAELETCEYYEARDNDKRFRERFLRERREW